MSRLVTARLRDLPEEEVIAAGEAMPLLVLGQNEWLSLPGLGIPSIDAKIDTGAQSSVLHAEEIEPFEKRGKRWVRFLCRPRIGEDSPGIVCEAKVSDQREVRSSNGEVEVRWFIKQTVAHRAVSWKMEMSLTNRHRMRHRMLLGRSALAGRFLVDPGRAYLLGPLEPELSENPPHSLA